jgi:hypothetical protein
MTWSTDLQGPISNGAVGFRVDFVLNNEPFRFRSLAAKALMSVSLELRNSKTSKPANLHVLQTLVARPSPGKRFDRVLRNLLFQGTLVALERRTASHRWP